MRLAIVEDSNVIVWAWRQALASTAHTAGFHGSTQSDIEALLEEGPDAVVVGSAPAGLSAMQIGALTRAHPKARDASLVLATSIDAARLARFVTFDLFDAVLPKPFTSEQVVELFDRLEAEQLRARRAAPLAVVVDDSATARTFLSSELRALGFEVLVANDGPSGIAMIEERVPDFVLADLEMPGFGGLELAERVAARARTGAVPVAIVSSRVDLQLRQRAFASGAQDFLSKPVNPGSLASLTSRVVGERRLKQAASRRALVVEDSRTVAALLCRFFDEVGVVSHVCRSIAEARALAQVLVPDIVTVDLGLPDGSGLDLCRELRSQPDFVHVPLVVVSGDDSRHVVVECLRAGANDYVPKPFFKEELQARITNLLDLRRLQADLVQKNRALEELAYYDGLTGLFNRLYLDRALTREKALAVEQQRSLAFVLVDLDFFKKVNDTHGHETGDEVLQSVAKLLKSHARPGDVAFRYGGEELGLLLPNTSLGRAFGIAEALRADCAARTHGKVQLCQTLSVGVSAYPATGPADDLVKAADLALYQAKRTGRNQVIAAEFKTA
jgi:two-component system cell cycle response regulator